MGSLDGHIQEVRLYDSESKYILCVTGILYLFLNRQKGEPLVAHRPQLRIVTPRGLSEPEEISADALSVRGFEQYRCDDYHLGRAMLIN